MKKFFIISTIILCSFTSVACEICGCGTGDYYLGLMPNFRKHFFGLRYQFSSFKTILKDDPTQYSNDHFQSVELWGGWNIGKRWQVLAIVPFNFIHQASDDGITDNSGIGDIALMGNYKIFERSSATRSKKLISQQLWLGAGIKLPTGKFLADQNDEAFLAIANTQTGSASTDFLLNGMYNVSIGDFGVNTSARYKMNTANNDKYYFGNKFSANSFAYYSFKKSMSVITPNAGLLYEHSEANKLDNVKVDQTGGYLFSTAAGIELSVKKITLGLNAQFPLTQNFADHQTQTKIKGMAHVSFSF